NSQMMETVRQAILAVNGSVPRFEMTTLEKDLKVLEYRRVTNTWLMALFDGISVSLAAAGLYSLIHFSVTQRRTEIGVRMALGAAPLKIMGMVLEEGIRLAFVGVAVGFVAAVIASHWFSKLIYGVSLYDLRAFGAVGVGVFLVTIIACIVPSLNAAR